MTYVLVKDIGYKLKEETHYNILVIVQKLTLAFMNAGYLESARAKSRLVTVQIDKMGIMHFRIKRYSFI